MARSKTVARKAQSSSHSNNNPPSLEIQICDFLQGIQKQTKKILYGTAGFRDNVNLPLEPVVVRVGLVACVRSQSESCKPVGVMVTASHNPECDNGVKIVDSDGGMLHQSWEGQAEKLVNANNGELADVFGSLLDFAGVTARDLKLKYPHPLVIVGRDTRPHSEVLASCLKKSVKFLEARLIDLGEVSTPQLHFTVGTFRTDRPYNEETVGEELKEAYYRHFAEAYVNMFTCAPSTLTSSTSDVNQVVVDASNGVGSIVLERVCQRVTAHLPPVVIRNKAYSGPVNEGCGAEYVQKGLMPPHGVSLEEDAGKLLCSLDGDADRIVFHSFLDGPSGVQWVLMDGDKIAALFVLLLESLLVAAAPALATYGERNAEEAATPIRLGVVQTAYANGASTNFFRSRGVDVSIARTGVKHLHSKAHELYDIGVYFEANGHGTILFSEKCQIIFAALAAEVITDPPVSAAILRLQGTVRLINQMIGDAISDLLLSLAALKLLEMSIRDWSGLYSDLPSKMIKVAVRDKNAVVCTEDETRVISPAALQDELDAVMLTCQNGRCFVRPSGTEDVVRVYAEAASLEEVEKLLTACTAAINKHI